MAIFLMKKYLKSVCHKIKNILNIIPAFFQKKRQRKSRHIQELSYPLKTK